MHDQTLVCDLLKRGIETLYVSFEFNITDYISS